MKLRSITRSLGMNRTVLALSVARLGDAVGNSILFIVLPLYVARLAAPLVPLPETVRVGFLLSLYGLVSALAQPLTGGLSDRLGKRKPLILAGLALMTVGTVAFVFADRFVDLLVLRAIQGVGVALTIPASMALMAAVTERETRGGAMGVFTTMRMTGFAVGPLLGGFLIVHAGFEAAFLAGAAFVAAGFVLVQVWVHDPPADVSPETQPRPRLLDRSLLSPGILGTGLATFLMANAFSLMVTLEKQFNSRLHQTAVGFSIAFSALMVSRLVFQLPLGRLSDRIGRKPLIVAGLILMAPATALLGLAASTAQLAGLRLLQGLAAAAIAAPALALAGDLSTRGGEGRQMSIVTVGFGLGIALGPLIAGVLALHSFELPFVVGGAMTLAGALVVLRFVPETVKRG